jgi:hypothetical protein
MTGPVRRTIEEIIARYELEPMLRDIYVEGMFDQEVVSRCLRHADKPDRIVYQVDVVEVPVELLKKYGMTDGNKQRVVTLARALGEVIANPSYRCLVDRDLDHWFGALDEIPGLVWTEYCATELYFFTDEILRDLLVVAARSKIEDWGKFTTSLIEALSALYAMRLADHELQWTMAWLSPEKHVKAKGSRIDFASTEYIARLLMKNRRSASAAEFESSFSKWRKRLSGDPRSFIRGHDLIEILCWVIRAFRGLKELASEVAVERILLLNASKVGGLAEILD